MKFKRNVGTLFLCIQKILVQAVSDNHPKVFFLGVSTLSAVSSNVWVVNCQHSAVFVNYACTVNITQQLAWLDVPITAIFLSASLETAHNCLAMKTMDAQRLCF